MSIILEEDNPDADIELSSVERAEDSFMILNAGVDDTRPPDDSADDSQSEFSDSSFLDIDEIEDGEIDTTQSIELDEVNQELEEVSSYMVQFIPKLQYNCRLTLKLPKRRMPKRIFVPPYRECTVSST
jgi:hypothetical protein